MIRRTAALALLLASAATAQAPQNSAPQPLPIESTIPAARDVPYPGTMRLDVDATDTQRAIFRVKQSIPVAAAGRLTLLYPQWLPGNHGPRGPIDKLAGLRFTANGRPLGWTRDPVDVYAIHIEVPEGARAIDAEFQFLSPTATNQGRVVMTPAMLNLQWNAMALYPAGYYTRGIMVQANATYPKGWKAAAALETASVGDTVRYKPVSFETLVDSPVFAGRNVRVEQMAPGVRLNIVADTPEQLAATPEQLQLHRNMVAQAIKLFGAQHYDHYDFLFALSEAQGGIGLEHHRSSENGVGADYFKDWDSGLTDRDLLAHEYTHSWNGKYRRGADLFTPDFRTPMRDSMLWVYEGQTQFWGNVLTARAGLHTLDEALGSLAADAALYDNRAGRNWRPVIDTTNDPIISSRQPKAWASWQRSEDYYVEGQLVWLEADSLIRQRSGGKRSLDDFAKAFFGVNDRDWGVLTYTFNDVVDTLNKVEPYDWRTFLNDRIYAVQPRAPLAWIERGGYRLNYVEEPTSYWKAVEKAGKATNLSYSGGLVVGNEGAVIQVWWDSPAFNAGLAVGNKIVAVDGQAYSGDALKTAIKAKKPVDLLVNAGTVYRTVKLDYTGGLRYPRLDKVGKGASTLEALLAAKK